MLMSNDINDVLANLVEELEDSFNEDGFKIYTMRMHFNFSLACSLQRMIESKKAFTLTDDAYEYILETFAIDLDENKNFTRGSQLTVKELFKRQFEFDQFFEELQNAESDYAYPVELWIGHIALRPNIKYAGIIFEDYEFFDSVYINATEQCDDWMIYDEGIIAGIKEYVADLFERNEE
ncbi:hypothetical protein E6W26_29095 [Pseudomonas aeruginosa]|uniref:hypothetical protein n=1 Tax=Pseudomonas aeruginosa TaxID=287 RepID=UPI00109DADC1|nr:hypothetical protein [Pseudomonas aeruginosa]EKV1241268.1 hypothetical protein [Pseudomonas aeruginosa]EKV8586177.1 hypothetical protein [Pseudomonas aeruginosa]ELN5407395.1 hypothetical protein [Pseudomonas aeruginosa]ELP1438586.1 hypothetical protein [Pseudomonas aeruginosa]THB16456.1 hypothetical protein E6W26_29095 [Pseudomonas aeruginosa]